MTHYERFLIKTVDELFEAAAETQMTWRQFAAKAGLAVSTVYNLGNRRTKFPQLRTIFLLAKAVRRNVRLLRKEIIDETASEIRQAVHS